MSANEKQRHYVEEVALQFEQAGLSRSAGRILGWLLICDPPHQTMNDLVEALQVSKSSVSTATRMLMQIGLVQRISLPGERRDYYRIMEGVWQNAIRERYGQVTVLRKLAERGLSLLSDRPAKQRRRLQEMHDLYAFFEREIPRLLTQWEEEYMKAGKDNE